MVCNATARFCSSSLTCMHQHQCQVQNVKIIHLLSCAGLNHFIKEVKHQTIIPSLILHIQEEQPLKINLQMKERQSTHQFRAKLREILYYVVPSYIIWYFFVMYSQYQLISICKKISLSKFNVQKKLQPILKKKPKNLKNQQHYIKATVLLLVISSTNLILITYWHQKTKKHFLMA